MGICLDSIEMFTTDSNGQKKFIDRNDSKFKGEPMRKSLILSNLGIYWNQSESKNNFYTSSSTPKETIIKMKSMIKRKIEK
jgi:hypothetical protein